MFGKVSDKTKREAYLTALSHERDSFDAKPAQESNVKQPSNTSIDGRPVLSGKDAIKLASKDINVTGSYDKNAIKDDNKIVNMKYYRNWRDRLAEVEKEEAETKEQVVYSNNTSNAGFVANDSVERVKPSYSGDEFGREPGLYGDDTTLLPEKKTYSSKDLLDNLYASNTKEDDGDDDVSILDKLFKNRELNPSYDSGENERKSFLNKRFATSYRDQNDDGRNETNSDMGYSSHLSSRDYDVEPDEDYTLDDFEDDFDSSFDDITANSTKVNAGFNQEPKDFIEEKEESPLKEFKEEKEELPTKKVVAPRLAPKITGKPRKKKKKYDADIVGVSGFFTA